VKISPVGDELFHADRRTDMSNPVVPVRSFANAHIKRRPLMEQASCRLVVTEPCGTRAQTSRV